MEQFLKLGHGTTDTTQPSFRFEGHEKPKTFVDWVLENGVTEPRLDAEKLSATPGSPVAERRLPSNRFAAVQVWMSTHQRVRPIDVLVLILLFVFVALLTVQLLEPAAPTLPPLR